MPVSHRIELESHLITTTWDGDATDDELIESMKKYQQDVQSNSDYQNFNEVLDLRKVKNIKITTKGIVKVAQIASATDDVKRRKCAIIVSSKLAFGMARMYEIYRSQNKNSNKEVNVFEEEEKALEWLEK